MRDDLLTTPQWTTSSRLLKLGESIRFDFYLPPGTKADHPVVFPKYLERANPGAAFRAGGDLGWLDETGSQHLELEFQGGHASAFNQPAEPGNYLVRWRVGSETLYRYFAVIEDDWIVLGFSTFVDLEAEPTLQATGIPLDYRLPIERYQPEDPLFQKFHSYHRRYGSTIIPHFPDTPKLSTEERIAEYGKGLERVRQLMPDANDARSARVDMRHDFDPGYPQAFAALGVNDHCGLNEANAKPWLGMPEFPYFSSPLDCRKANQGKGGLVVAHQWDFCGGWHFIGPVSWHYAASEGNWEYALRCISQGMQEARNLAELSGHPAFLVPLYDGVIPYGGYPNKPFTEGWGGEPMLRFVERYQRQIAFEFTKEFKLAFMRTVDLSDYYRRHYKATPRTVFVSTTSHVLYDMWWLCFWAGEGILIPRERIPWLTRMSTIMKRRKMHAYLKDPLSCEYILVEDQKRQMRFERECPNPVWWFDYTRQDAELTPEGSSISHVETPDVEVLRSKWVRDDGNLAITLKMRTSAIVTDYAIALWDVPAAFSSDRSRVTTNAKDFLLVKNTDSAFHMVLFFDLKPDAELQVALWEP